MVQRGETKAVSHYIQKGNVVTNIKTMRNSAFGVINLASLQNKRCVNILPQSLISTSI